VSGRNWSPPTSPTRTRRLSRQDIDFRSEFENAAAGDPPSVSKHGAAVKTDGNNVNLDRESVCSQKTRCVSLSLPTSRAANWPHFDPRFRMVNRNEPSSALSVSASGCRRNARALNFWSRIWRIPTRRALPKAARIAEDASSWPIPGRPVLFAIRSQVHANRWASRLEVITDTREPEKRYLPGHPDATDGYVASRMIPPRTWLDLLGASRSYQANVAAIPP